MKVNNEIWTVEIGQPWRNARAGLTDTDVARGAEMPFFGKPLANIGDRRPKVERLELCGKMYEI